MPSRPNASVEMQFSAPKPARQSTFKQKKLDQAIRQAELTIRNLHNYLETPNPSAGNETVLAVAKVSLNALPGALWQVNIVLSQMTIQEAQASMHQLNHFSKAVKGLFLLREDYARSRTFSSLSFPATLAQARIFVQLADEKVLLRARKAAGYDHNRVDAALNAASEEDSDLIASRPLAAASALHNQAP